MKLVHSSAERTSRTTKMSSRSSRSCFAIGPSGPASVAQVERLAEHRLPLLLLGGGQDGLDATGVLAAGLLDLRPDRLGVALLLRLPGQRPERPVQPLDDL